MLRLKNSPLSLDSTRPPGHPPFIRALHSISWGSSKLAVQFIICVQHDHQIINSIENTCNHAAGAGHWWDWEYTNWDWKKSNSSLAFHTTTRSSTVKYGFTQYFWDSSKLAVMFTYWENISFEIMTYKKIYNTLIGSQFIRRKYCVDHNHGYCSNLFATTC